MQQTEFVINDRFLVDVGRNELLDKTTNIKNRLEPRFMKLLHLLADHEGKIVRRELIIKEIWDDYPGANEGLNQAISFLRKLLADEQKSIIQTQPKTGYIFQAKISKGSNDQRSFRKKHVHFFIGATFVFLLSVLGITIYSRKTTSTLVEQQLNQKKYFEISINDSMRFIKDTLGPAAKGDSIRRK
jgi:DNA-binding winged helix-turn-helix (wHTH) protein